MAIYNKCKVKNVFMGKLDYGKDILEELTNICEKENITLGIINALGAVQKANVGFYNQETKEYQFQEFDEPLEITALIGNVSLRDGKPIIPAHITLSDEPDNAIGGHMIPGTTVFACEFEIIELDGPAYKRGLDDVTGLPLWKM